MAATKLVCGFAIYKYTSVRYGVEALPILGQALALGALMSFVSSGGISRGTDLRFESQRSAKP